MPSPFAVDSAACVLPCSELGDTLAFFIDRLGFRLDAIHPADDPTTAVLSGYGLRLRLERGSTASPGTLRLACSDPAAVAGGASVLVAPNGTRIELAASVTTVDVPPLRPSFVLSRAGDARWIEGRAGMRYRDLIPDRQGGRFIASHIQIPGGGPVPDYVHFHAVLFQLIFCARGWVRVIYEDQGPPFVLAAGDAVLQPPRIRHRVLEASPGLEVVEIGCPAQHATFAEHDLLLPTSVVRPERDFGGQRFVRHEASKGERRVVAEGVDARDLGIAAATRGLAGARVLRVSAGGSMRAPAHDGELLFSFLLEGEATLRCDGREAEVVASRDAFVVPPGQGHAIAATTDLELLELRVGGA